MLRFVSVRCSHVSADLQAVSVSRSTALWQVLLHGKNVARHSASELDEFVSIFFRVLEQLGEEFTADHRKRLAEVSSSFGADKVASVGGKLVRKTSRSRSRSARSTLTSCWSELHGGPTSSTRS